MHAAEDHAIGRLIAAENALLVYLLELSVSALDGLSNRLEFWTCRTRYEVCRSRSNHVQDIVEASLFFEVASLAYV